MACALLRAAASAPRPPAGVRERCELSYRAKFRACEQTNKANQQGQAS